MTITTKSRPYSARSPLDIINNNLGVCADCEFKYICPHIREEYKVYVKESNNYKLHDKQIVMFKKMIEILKKTSPLCPLLLQSTISKGEQGLILYEGEIQESEEEKEIKIIPDDKFMFMVASDDASDKAEVLISIFYDRIRPQLSINPHAEAFHRSQFAWALEQHLAMNFSAEKDVCKEKKSSKITSESKDRKSTERMKKPRSNSTPNTALGLNEIKPSPKISGSSSEVSEAKTKKGKFQLNLSGHDLVRHSGGGANSPKGISSKASPHNKEDVARLATLKILKAKTLENCMNFWANSYFEHKAKESGKVRINFDSWNPYELILINNVKLLTNPMMHQLIQCVLSNDIFEGISAHSLMVDIDRNMDHIDKAHHGGAKAYQRNKQYIILDVKDQDLKNSKEFDDYDSKVSYFYHVLERFLNEIDINKTHPKEQNALLNLWKECALEQVQEHIEACALEKVKEQNKKSALEIIQEDNKKSSLEKVQEDNEKSVLEQLQESVEECESEQDLEESEEQPLEKVQKLNNQSFLIAGINFYKKIDQDVQFNQKLTALLVLLRQKNYNQPLQIIHRVTPDIPIIYDYDDPQRIMRFAFKKGNVEFCTTLKGTPLEDASKWKDGKIKCSGFEIEIISIMRSENSDLNAWNSTVNININIKTPKGEKNKVPPEIQKEVIDPLQWVGLDVKVNFTGITSSF